VRGVPLTTIVLLHAYRHAGFWRSMDTHKDVLALDELAAGGVAPWLDLRSA